MQTADSTLDRLEGGFRTARRVVRDSTRKADDLMYDGARVIRRRPLGSVGTAFLAGAALGSIIMLIARRPRHY